MTGFADAPHDPDAPPAGVLVQQLLDRLRAHPGVAVDARGDPIVLRIGGRVVARLRRFPASLVVLLPDGAGDLHPHPGPGVRPAPGSLRIDLVHASDVRMAERVIGRRLSVERTIAQYAERSP